MTMFLGQRIINLSTKMVYTSHHFETIEGNIHFWYISGQYHIILLLPIIMIPKYFRLRVLYKHVFYFFLGNFVIISSTTKTKQGILFSSKEKNCLFLMNVLLIVFEIKPFKRQPFCN